MSWSDWIGRELRAASEIPTVEPMDVTGYRNFLAGAIPALDVQRQKLAEAIGSSQSGRAMWHPNGFLVFHLLELEDLGTLRLHIWPGSDRIIRPWGPKLHKHGWHLASRILVGRYEDVLYGENADSHKDSLTMLCYKIDITAQAPDYIYATGETRSIYPHVHRRVPAGSFHAVPANVFHDTVVPDADFVATLVVESQLKLFESVTLDTEDAPPRDFTRVRVSERDAKVYLRELEDRLLDSC